MHWLFITVLGKLRHTLGSTNNSILPCSYSILLLLLIITRLPVLTLLLEHVRGPWMLFLLFLLLKLSKDLLLCSDLRKL